MTSDELIQEFQSSAARDGSLHHIDHVRLGFECLRQSTVLEAIGTFSNALRRFAADRGKPQLYHETITWAYILLIRERLARTEAKDWEQFAQQNSDLLVWKGGVLSRYYQEATLASDLARTGFIFPDKCPS